MILVSSVALRQTATMTLKHRNDRIHGEMTTLASQGMALLKAGRPADCLQLLNVADIAEHDPRFLALKAYAHAILGQIPDALPAARLALATDLSALWALDLLGNAFTLCHQPGSAYEAFARARKVAPDQPEVLLNFATAAGFMGHADEAERTYDRIIAAAPKFGDAYLNRSLLRRQMPEANHVPEIRAAIGTCPGPWQRDVQLRYALAKELEDLGEYDAAFANVMAGAALRRSHMRYAVSDDIAAMKLITATHGSGWCAAALASHPDDGPIFILGLPRSGSTLLERALGRHSTIQSLGELQFFGQALIATVRDALGRMPSGKEELIHLSAGLDFGAIATAYLAAVAPLRNDRPRFIDKLPINFLYAGLIARTLPTATLIHIRRDPLDLCVAIFKTLFRDAYPFSYDLAELGTYHRAYQALMDHWRHVLGDRLIEINYEDLVASPRDTLSTLLHRLGLGLEDACLNPEHESAAVMTASAAQVRQPIHARSVGSAAHYAKHLGPLVAALGG